MTMTILSIAMAVALASGPTQARAPAPTAQQQQRQVSERRVRFNQRELSAAELRTLEQLEVAYRFRLPNGDYWYDPVSGAAGAWGGPTVGFFPAGLQLGGKLAANASGGGTRV